MHRLVETDALAFIWGSTVVGTTTYFAASPANRPRLFSESEGGNATKGVTIPNWQVALGAATAPVLVAAVGDDSRWHHTAGIVESLLTTATLTELSKNIVGRHRPEYVDMSMNPDDRKSFFSGHSSLTLATTTYLGLYMHDHVFARWRGNQRVAWWEIPPYAALVAASVWVPYTRIQDNMHHPSDVLVGGVVGASLSAAFYLWHERSYRDEVAIMPLIDTPGAAMTIALD